MKNMLKILLVFVISINASCQVTKIVPVNRYDSTKGVYQKDLDNQLPFWVGTWKGEINNIEYTFINTLFTQHLIEESNGYYRYVDAIMSKIKVRNVITNQILYDDTSVINYDNYKIIGLTIYGNQFDFLFSDKEANCYNTVRFSLIKNNTNLNQITYTKFKYGEYYGLVDPCPYANQEDIPMFLPKEELVLTRQ